MKQESLTFQPASPTPIFSLFSIPSALCKGTKSFSPYTLFFLLGNEK